MKKSTFSPAKIAGVLKEFAGGRSAEVETSVILTTQFQFKLTT